MQKQIKSVTEFMELFKRGYSKVPTLGTKETQELRYKLLLEELNEYKEACDDGDMIGLADALGDQLYIILGTIIEHGFQDKIEQIFDIIHQSNLSKLDENGNPIIREDGKIVKSSLYTPPDLTEIINT